MVDFVVGVQGLEGERLGRIGWPRAGKEGRIMKQIFFVVAFVSGDALGFGLRGSFDVMDQTVSRGRRSCPLRLMGLSPAERLSVRGGLHVVHYSREPAVVSRREK